MNKPANQHAPEYAQQYQQKAFALLEKFARQRPGLEFANYGDLSAYRSELRSITKDLHHARALLAACAWRSFTPDQIRAAFRAFSGRLKLEERDGLPYALNYCTGQYFPTEYRRAVCAVVASLLWDDVRENSMPAPSRVGDMAVNHGAGIYEGLSAGDWLRRYFRREFGRGIASRWFD